MPISAFGQNVKRLRLANNPPLKAYELADMIDTDPSVVSRWEKGKGGLPESPTLLRLAKKLKVTIDALLDGVDDEYTAIVHKVTPSKVAGFSDTRRQRGHGVSTDVEFVAERERYTVMLQAIGDVAAQLYAILADADAPQPGGKGRTAAKRAGQRRRAPRAVGRSAAR